MDSKDLLKPPGPPPAPKKKPVLVLGSGEPECDTCEGHLDEDGFCPTCDHTDLDTEIDL